MFFTWYFKELWRFTASNKNEVSALRKISKMIIYMKLLLPATCTIFQHRPDRTSPVEDNNHKRWMTELRTISTEAQQLTMQFCKEYYESINQPLSNTVLKKAAVWAMFKNYYNIPLSYIVAKLRRTVVAVVDTLTTSNENIENSNDIRSFHKKK
jgi:hypothetical protein